MSRKKMPQEGTTYIQRNFLPVIKRKEQLSSTSLMGKFNRQLPGTAVRKRVFQKSTTRMES
jgi:hypothetical protein